MCLEWFRLLQSLNLGSALVAHFGFFEECLASHFGLSGETIVQAFNHFIAINVNFTPH